MMPLGSRADAHAAPQNLSKAVSGHSDTQRLGSAPFLGHDSPPPHLREGCPALFSPPERRLNDSGLAHPPGANRTSSLKLSKRVTDCSYKNIARRGQNRPGRRRAYSCFLCFLDSKGLWRRQIELRQPTSTFLTLGHDACC